MLQPPRPRQLDTGAEEVVCEIDGAEYRQAPFPYQGKCLRWLRQGYEAGDAGLGYWIANTFAFTEDREALFAWLERMAAEGTLGQTNPIAPDSRYGLTGRNNPCPGVLALFIGISGIEDLFRILLSE